jgi:hypothetical protein
MRSVVVAASIALASSSPFLVVGCDAEVKNPPPLTPTGPVTSVMTVGLDGSAPSGPDAAVALAEPSTTSDAAVATTGAPDAGTFYSCNASTDCVAVPKVGCCYNGYREAVNKGSVLAYKASFVCDNPHPMCPQYLIRDTRVPRCSPTLHRCEMVGAEGAK